MSNKSNFSFYILKSVPGVLLYCAMIIIFLLERSRFTNLYLLYVGNFLFAAWMFIVLIEISKKSVESVDFWSLVKAGLMITRNAIIISCVLITILLLVDTHTQLLRAPANSSGLAPILFLDASVVNFFVAMFATLYVAINANRRRKTVSQKEI